METEFIVIGGGILGCSVAYELASRSVGVLLLERDAIAAGASGGPGKRGVRANGRDPRELPLAAMATEMWSGLSAELDADIGYVQSGSLRLAEETSAVTEDQLTAIVGIQESAGVATKRLTGGEVRELEPVIGQSVVAGVRCPMDGVADHTATTLAFASAASRGGASIVEDCAAAAIAPLRNGRTSVTTTGGERHVATRGVMIAVNTQPDHLLLAVGGLPLSMWRAAPQMNFVKARSPIRVRHLLGHFHRALSIKQLGLQRFMLSGGRTGLWNETTGEGSVSEDVFRAVLEDAVAVIPDLANAVLEHGDAGRADSYSPGGVPCIDLIPGLSNVLFAGGWSGHGFAIGPAAGRLAASWLSTRTRPELLVPFGFHTHGPIRPSTPNSLGDGQASNG